MIHSLRVERRLLLFVFAAVIAFGVLFSHDPSLLQAGTYAAIYSIATIGLSILLGNVGQISLGQAGFFAIGAYTVAFGTTTLHLPFAFATPIAIVLSALAGYALGRIALRFHGHVLAMVTLAFGLIIVGILNGTDALGAANGIADIPIPKVGSLTMSGIPAFAMCWLLVALVTLASMRILTSTLGFAFRATDDDMLAAEAVGIGTRGTKLVAFVFAGALAGFSGAIYAGFLGIVLPSSVGVSLSVDMLLMVVLGGAGGISGAIVGASVVSILNIYGHTLGDWRFVLYGALVIAIASYLPGGLVGFARRKPVASSAAKTRDQATPHQEVSTMIPASSCAAGHVSLAPPLRLAGVTKRFAGLLAVNNVTFTVDRGTLTSLIGPNGAGKTTLFNTICGIGSASKGDVFINGVKTTRWESHRIARIGVGRTFQNTRLFDSMTVAENLVAVAAGRARAGSAAGGADAFERAQSLLAALHIQHLSEMYTTDLAFGDRRRVELARALAAEPSLLLLDEPAAGLNALERMQLHKDLRSIRDGGVTILLVEHDVKLVMDVSDRVIVLEFGRVIADGEPTQVQSDKRVIEAYLGVAEEAAG